jgi:hypothetical protein
MYILNAYVGLGLILLSITEFKQGGSIEDLSVRVNRPQAYLQVMYRSLLYVKTDYHGGLTKIRVYVTEI